MNVRFALVVVVSSLALLVAIAAADALASGGGAGAALLLALSAPTAALGLAVLLRAAYLDGRRARAARTQADRLRTLERERRER